MVAALVPAAGRERRMSRSTARRAPRARDPYGSAAGSSALAPGLSVVGLLLVAWVTLGVRERVGAVRRWVRRPGGHLQPHARPVERRRRPGGHRSPGAIVYAKAGNIWVQRGGDARQVTSGGRDSMPSWAPDGQSILFIRTTEEQGLWPAQGADRHYRMDVPALMRVAADGATRARGAPDRPDQAGRPILVLLDPPARCCRPTARRSR